MLEDIKLFLEKNSEEGFVTLFTCKRACELFTLSLREVEGRVFESGLTPYRYKRNQQTITQESQKRLFNSSVAIIGCGGLGGHVAENLTRLGVGKLILFDFDVFEEHNLNRQRFSSYEVIGREKVFVVQREIQKINPTVQIEAHCKKFDVQDDFYLLKECDVIIDALDNPQTKLELSFTCKEQNIAFVHGAIAGMSAQHSTNTTLQNLYKDGSRGVENIVGNPSFTVAYAAALQSSECLKLLLHVGESLEGKILFSNLLDNEFILMEN